MSTVAFITFVHPPRYVKRLHNPGVLRTMVESHDYPFDDIVVIHQRCKAEDYPVFDLECRTVDLPSNEFNDLLQRNGVNPHNPRAEELSHGPSGAHYYKHHLVNHLRGSEVTTSDYIVFADCDTFIKNQPPDRSWVEEGIYLLNAYPHILIVGPGDGGEAGGMGEGGKLPNGARLTRNVSQQLFICRGEQFRNEIDFDVPWDGDYWAPGGPFREWYVMMEGRLGMYMRKVDAWRAILPDRWRYWHFSQWDPPKCYEEIK